MSDKRKPEVEPVAEGQTPHEALAAEIVEGDSETLPPEEARPRARLLPMWILISAVVVVGAAWALSDRYFGEPEIVEGDVQLVTAEETPVKVRPKDPGGVEVPDRDKYVYKSLTEAEPDAEQLLPPPEEPMELPAAVVDKRNGVLAEGAETPEAPRHKSEAEIQATSDVTLPVEEAFSGPKTLVSEPEDILPKMLSKEVEPVAETMASTAADKTAAALTEQAGESEPGPLSMSETEFAPKPASEPASKPVKTTALTADASGFLLQIGATQQEGRAAGEITRLAEKHPEILGDLDSVVVRIDLGEKGVWYRMRVGSFASRAEAEATCDELKAVNVGCFVVAN